jgi:hypothetical protein
MKDYHVTSPEMVNKQTMVQSLGRTAQHRKGGRLLGQSRRVRIMLGKLKLPAKLRWW